MDNKTHGPVTLLSDVSTVEHVAFGDGVDSVYLRSRTLRAMPDPDDPDMDPGDGYWMPCLLVPGGQSLRAGDKVRVTVELLGGDAGDE